MNVVPQAEILPPVDDFSLVDPGAILAEIVYPYDETFGDPAIHYFQVLQRDGDAVTIAGIAKELIPGLGFERDIFKRVRPVKDAFVRACSVCRDREPRSPREDESLSPDFAAIDDARWNAYDGTGLRHDEASLAFEHAFADYIPTATLDVRFHGAEPFVRTGACSPVLVLVPPHDVRPASGVLLLPKAPAPRGW